MSLSPRIKKLFTRFDFLFLLSTLFLVVWFRHNTVVLFVLILLLLVAVHEFGHFIVAKWVNMRVDEFAFGFPPRIFAKKVGETTYAINALPLGGYVSIWGENGEPDDVAKNHPRAFGNRPWWAQLLVLVAGVTMNMLLALFVFIGISYGNVQMSASDEVYGARVKNTELMVVDAAPTSPAYLAGIVPGSVLVKVTAGKSQANLDNATSLISFIAAHNNDPFTITYKRADGKLESTTIAAVYGIVEDKKAIGVSVERVGYMHANVFDAIKIGSIRTYDMTAMTLEGLGSLVTSLTQGKNVLSSLSGPIGIAKIVGQTNEHGYEALLTLIAVLSINLAIFNILPLPALDGGRMVVVTIEAIARRKVPHKYYSWVNIVGFFALMLLLVIVTVHDVRG
ncbi:MAG: site-2 protease family protein [Candidatus Paceibacterota bacterium]